MNISLMAIMITGVVALGAMAGRAIFALQKQASPVKIPVLVRSKRQWRE